MTKQSEVINDSKYLPVLDHGFVGLIDYMGDDSSIVQAARVSYGDGTKTVMEDRGLIRYLLRHHHSTPFEMCIIKLHLKMPIFAARQFLRHRASINEYSGRYSLMSDEFYMPQSEVIQPQSDDNKQGRAGSLSEQNIEGVKWMLKAAYEHNYDIYKILLGEKNGREDIYDPYSKEQPLFDDEFTGVARELARAVLPVANYTEFYFAYDLKNMFNLINLRLDSHAQYEIRVFADAIYKLIQPIFPLALEAFEDYSRQALHSSRMEVNLLKMLLLDRQDMFTNMVREAGGQKAFAEANEMSLRELKDFASQWNFELPKNKKSFDINQ